MRNLFIEYWNSSSRIRNSEIKNCILKNYKLNLFDNIFIATEHHAIEKFFNNYKNIKIIKRNTRCTFYHAAYFLNEFITNNKLIPENVSNIISNSDIEFTDSITLVDNMSNDEFYGLTRYEPESEEDDIEVWLKHKSYASGNGRDSQDCWIYKGIYKNLNKEHKVPFGVPGCDNKIAYLAKKDNYKLLNPCYDIRILHNHKTNYRAGSSSNTEDRITDGYVPIDPCSLSIKEIHELEKLKFYKRKKII